MVVTAGRVMVLSIGEREEVAKQEVTVARKRWWTALWPAMASGGTARLPGWQ